MSVDKQVSPFPGQLGGPTHGPTLASVGEQDPAREPRANFAVSMFKTATDSLGLSGMTMYQTRHSGTSIDRVRGFRLYKSAKNFQSCRNIRQKQPSGSQLPLPHSHVSKQTVNTRAKCRSTNQPAHKRLTGKFLVNVFGGTGDLFKMTDHLRGYVLDAALYASGTQEHTLLNVEVQAS